MATVSAILEGTTIKGLIETYERLAWKRAYWGGGVFSLKIAGYDPARSLIQKGRWFIPDLADPDVLYRIEQIEAEQDQEGRATDFWTVSGRAFDGLFEERLIEPAAGSAYDAQTAVPAETAMLHYVNGHAGPGAAAARQFPGLTLAPDQARGAAVTLSGRYQAVSDALEAIGKYSGLGWRVKHDLAALTDVFEIVQGVDRSASVFFDLDFDTIVRQHWLSTDVGRKTVAIVAGQGEGAARTIVKRYAGGVEPTGFDRREGFVDARDTDDAAELAQRGDTALVGSVSPDLFEAEINPNGSFKFGRDWALGDLVTVRNQRWGIAQTARVVGVIRTLDATEGESLSVELDRPFPSLKDRIEQASGGTGTDAITPDSIAAVAKAGDTMTGALWLPDGSAAAPALAFASAHGTGLWTPAAATLAISTSGLERLRIDASGRVGVGTTPAARLDVMGGYIRARDDGSNIAPTSGKGLELISVGGIGFVLSYDRDTPAWQQLNLEGIRVVLAPNGTETHRFDAGGFQHTSSNTYFGTHPTYGGNFGAIWHSGKDYSFMVGNLGETFVNAPTGQTLRLRYNNSDVARLGQVTNGVFEVTTALLADADVSIRNAAHLYVYDSNNAQWVRLFRDGTNAFLEQSLAGGALYLSWFAGGGGVNVGNGAANYGTIRAAAFTVSSSAASKENIAPLPDDDATTGALQPVTYTRDGDTSKTYTGFIAEDVQAVYPGAVVQMTMVDDAGNETPTLGIDVLALQGITVSALRRLIARFKALADRVATVETTVSNQATQIAALNQARQNQAARITALETDMATVKTKLGIA